MTANGRSAGDEPQPSGLVGGDCLYRVSWAKTPAARPLTQEQLATAGLALALHGPGGMDLKKSHHDELAGDPWYLWSGTCRGAWAVSFRPATDLPDLGGGAAVRWRARQSGSHRLRLVLEHETQGWLVSRQAHGATDGWREFALDLHSVAWHHLDIGAVIIGEPVAAVSLDRVRAFGVADLAAGDGSDACSRLEWLELRAATSRDGA
ncbi:hypothetical protein GPROT2_01206 [Gammaproteobacteria bacterium]|nr:hypothetical protein GPROT2_01206 [Gammaproteobacteria bacterium]